jgi:hypothetical protein
MRGGIGLATKGKRQITKLEVWGSNPNRKKIKKPLSIKETE